MRREKEWTISGTIAMKYGNQLDYIDEDDKEESTDAEETKDYQIDKQ